ncbi:YggS family pyridoxal phosphate-dependent enzyme [Leptospira sp. 96542]|nr:YggS family pyridoxal phosphate-dependent enzyme [Leptospira sp. 96542]
MADYGKLYHNLDSDLTAKYPGSSYTLIAVSKTKPFEVVRDAYLQGIRHFGENYIPEAIDKFSKLRDEFPEARESVFLHHIGPVQSGNLRKLFGVFQFTHGVGSVSSLKELSKRAAKDKLTIRYFLQINATGESTKHGFSLEEIQKWKDDFPTYQNEFCIWEGFMAMGPSSGDPIETRETFKSINQFRKLVFPDKKLSMGMSGDYELALEEGSNFLRIGSLIFGDRNYAK